MARFQRDKSAQHMFYTYILECSDKKTYIGSTNDLKERLYRHQSGYVPATAKRIPVKIVAYFAFSRESVARDFEKYLKSGSGRAFLKKHQIVAVISS